MATMSEHMDSDMETIPEWIILDRSHWEEQPARRVPCPEVLASHPFQRSLTPLACLDAFEQLVLFACIWQ